jgi:hypothetical protein
MAYLDFDVGATATALKFAMGSFVRDHPEAKQNFL